MRTSKSWWEETLASPEKLIAWLFKQYRGEVTAAGRILALRDAYAHPYSKAFQILSAISEQEKQHAVWVGQLLEELGQAPTLKGEPHDRYWKAMQISGVSDLETGCAIGAHAEQMRLARIQAIVEHPQTPESVRSVFMKILPEERFHAQAFLSLTTAECLVSTRDNHELGMEILGLSE